MWSRLDDLILAVSVYAIEATVHAPSFEGVYGEIFKVLKPNGVVSYSSQICFCSHVNDMRIVVWLLRMGHGGPLGPIDP